MPIFRTSDFGLVQGGHLPLLEIAYETYGEMSPARDNVILVTHGVTSSHHAAGTPTADRRRGWYDELIGLGKLLDISRYCIFSSNVLGSCYGSTGPCSVDPATGKRYGASFPEVRYEDIVRAQKLALESLGVERLVAVVGTSIGGFQVFQWAVSHPTFMKGLIATDTAPRDTFDSLAGVQRLIDHFSAHPGWNGGDYYETGGIENALTELRIGVLKSYGFEAGLDAALGRAERDAIIESTARDWAREFDANSLIVMQRAWGNFDVTDQLDRIEAKLLLVLCDTDEWFPAKDGKAVMDRLVAAGVDARFHEIRSAHGHYATALEPEKWMAPAERLLASLGE